MLKLNIQNFRNIRSLDMTDEGKLTLIVGLNESGKSSLTNAIKFAFTGEAYGHKGKDLDTLVTHGEPRFAIRVQVNDLLVNRTSYGTGDSVTDIAQRLDVSPTVMPVLFDSQMAGDGGNKAMRAFLTGTSADQFDPSVHFATTNPSIKECSDLAKRSGKLQVKAIVTFCEGERAKQQKPDKPVLPTLARPTAEQLQQAMSDIAVLTQQQAQAKADQDSALAISQDLSQVANYLRAMDDYQTKLATTRTDDVLGSRRLQLDRLSSCNPKTLENISQLLASTGHDVVAKELDALQSTITALIMDARKTIADNPPPASAPAKPVEPAIFAEYRNSLEAGGKAIKETLPTYLAQATTAVQSNNERYQAATAALSAGRQKSDSYQQALGAWATYDANNMDYEAKAHKSVVEWERWNTAAKEIQAAHLVFLTEQSERFSNIVSGMGAAVLGGRKLTIDITNGITLNGIPIEEVSVSTKWRMEIVVMTAVAATLRSPLLVIDGADVLDVHNRRVLTTFITDNVVPHFKHVILTMTAKDDISLEKPLPAGIASRWIMNNGQISKL